RVASGHLESDQALLSKPISKVRDRALLGRFAHDGPPEYIQNISRIFWKRKMDVPRPRQSGVCRAPEGDGISSQELPSFDSVRRKSGRQSGIFGGPTVRIRCLRERNGPPP